MPRRLRVSRLQNLTLQAGSGSFAWAGNSASFVKSTARVLQALAGTFAWSGFNAVLSKQKFRLQATAGTFGITGRPATFTYTPASTLGWANAGNIFPITLQQGQFYDLSTQITGNQALIGAITPTLNSSGVVTVPLPTGVSITNNPSWRLVASQSATVGVTANESLEIVPAATQVSIASYGAVQGTTVSNTNAIHNAIAHAKLIGASVLVPAGTWAFSGNIFLDSVTLTGVGDTSILYAMNPDLEAVMMIGTGPQIRSLQFSGVTPTARSSDRHANRIVAEACTGFTVDSVLITSSSAVGIMSFGSSQGTISNNRISGTLADGIHMTNGSNNITVSGNTIQNTADDGIATVSYQGDGVLCSNITARNNSVSGNTGGRGMSVVGGQDVLYEQNTITNSGTKAGILIAQESSFHSYGCTRITAQFNTLTNCGSTATGHAAIFINDSNELPNTTIRITRNDIIQTPGAGQFGLRVDSGQNVDIIFDQNRISGTTTANETLNQCTPPATVNPYVSGPVGVGAGSAAADWANRISGTGVVWYHSFDTDAEVNNFRRTNGYGSDPNPAAGHGTPCARVATGGADGGGYMRMTYRVGQSDGSTVWWRPYAPFTAAGNGRGANDPGANGTIPVQAWAPSDGNDPIRSFTAGNSHPAFYGSTTDISANPSRYDGNDFYIQIRHRRPEMPGKPPNSGSFTNITGKSIWHNVTTDTSTNCEIVTYGNSQISNVGQRDPHVMYEGRNRSGGPGIGGDSETDTINNHDGVSDWKYSGGWDTLMYHVTPGTNNGTGTNRTRLEVWAQHDLTLFPAESGVFTKIWDVLYSVSYEIGNNSIGAPSYAGWNAMLCAIYHNGSVFTTSTFNFDYDQIIFSKSVIPAPTT